MTKGRRVNLRADPHLAPQLRTNNIIFLIACTPLRCAKGQICVCCHTIILCRWVHCNYEVRSDVLEFVWTANEEFCDGPKVASWVSIDRSEELCSKFL